MCVNHMHMTQPEVLVIHDVIRKHKWLIVTLLRTDMYAGAATQHTDAVFDAKMLLSKFNATKITEWVPN